MFKCSTLKVSWRKNVLLAALAYFDAPRAWLSNVTPNALRMLNDAQWKSYLLINVLSTMYLRTLVASYPVDREV